MDDGRMLLNGGVRAGLRGGASVRDDVVLLRLIPV